MSMSEQEIKSISDLIRKDIDNHKNDMTWQTSTMAAMGLIILGGIGFIAKTTWDNSLAIREMTGTLQHVHTGLGKRVVDLEGVTHTLSDAYNGIRSDFNIHDIQDENIHQRLIEKLCPKP